VGVAGPAASIVAHQQPLQGRPLESLGAQRSSDIYTDYCEFFLAANRATWLIPDVTSTVGHRSLVCVTYLDPVVIYSDTILLTTALYTLLVPFNFIPLHVAHRACIWRLALQLGDDVRALLSKQECGRYVPTDQSAPPQEDHTTETAGRRPARKGSENESETYCRSTR
jgi:hypothetical protein